MSIRKVAADLIPLTRDFALHIATLAALPGERERKASRVAYFRNHLKQGSFASPTWSTVIVKDTGKEYRADGQHTSYALSQTPEENFPVGLTVTHQRFEIDSLSQDAIALFDCFDSPKSVRSNSDVMGVYLSEHQSDLSMLSREFMVKVTNAVDFYVRDLHKREPDNPKLPLFYQARQHGLYLNHAINREFAVWLSQWLEAKNAWLMSKPAVVAEMLSEWMTKTDTATTFWNYVFLNNHPDVNHETRELADRLNELRRKPRVKQEDFRNLTKKLWSRFRRVEEAEAKTRTSTSTDTTAYQPVQRQNQPSM